MITEEYLSKMDNLENRKQETGKTEIQEKKSMPFTKLGVYIHLLPIIIELLETVDKAEKNKHTKLWLMLYETSGSVLKVSRRPPKRLWQTSFPNISVRMVRTRLELTLAPNFLFMLPNPASMLDLRL